MKNFDEYIIEKLKVTNNKQLTLGDIYKITKLNCSMGASMEPERFLILQRSRLFYWQTLRAIF